MLIGTYIYIYKFKYLVTYYRKWRISAAHSVTSKCYTCYTPIGDARFSVGFRCNSVCYTVLTLKNRARLVATGPLDHLALAIRLCAPFSNSIGAGSPAASKDAIRCCKALYAVASDGVTIAPFQSLSPIFNMARPFIVT